MARIIQYRPRSISSPSNSFTAAMTNIDDAFNLAANTLVTTTGTLSVNTQIFTYTGGGQTSGPATYTGVAQSATSGTGTGGTFTIKRNSSGFVSVAFPASVGTSGYAAGDTVTIPAANIGGAVNGAADLVLTLTSNNIRQPSDSLWTTYTGNGNENPTMVFNFDLPQFRTPAELGDGVLDTATTQILKVWMRRTNNANVAQTGTQVSATLALRVEGSTTNISTSNITLTDATAPLTGGYFALSWTYSAASAVLPSGTNVNLAIIQTAGGVGGASNARRFMSVGAVEFTAAFTDRVTTNPNTTIWVG